jgi:hypothetical protein
VCQAGEKWFAVEQRALRSIQIVADI